MERSGEQRAGMLEAKDPYRYVFEQPMALPPGVLFNYCGGATSLLATIHRSDSAATGYSSNRAIRSSPRLRCDHHLGG
jgi:hypothetical protein